MDLGSKEEERKTVSLHRLYLDPNNFRFIDKADYVKVSDEKIKDAQIQKRTRRFISGTNNEEIDDLIRSYKTNGYLPVDQIQARPLDDSSYLVIEGNRRITALKYLEERFEAGDDIGNLNPSIFAKVPIIITRGVDESHYKILMGLKHISGNKKWPSINQAQLLRTLLNEGMTKQEIKDALGISTVTLNRYLKSLALVDQYKDSELGDQFRSEKFNIFSEVIKQPKIMFWLGWDDYEAKAKNVFNLNRFFSWISSEDDLQLDGDDDVVKTLEPIINRGDDIRELAQLISDEKLLEKMELSRSISQAYLASDKISSDKFSNSLEIIEKQLGDAFNFVNYANDESKEKLKSIRRKFEGLLTTQGSSEVLVNRDIKRDIFIRYTDSHFSSINVENYKRLKTLSLNNLNRINLIGGDNNSGKSSLLEAVYLLCILNDIFSFTEIFRRRGKFFNDLPSLWLAKQISGKKSVSGVFDGKSVSSSFNTSNENDDFDKSSYLTSIYLESFIGNARFDSRLRLFENKDSQAFFPQILNLCNVKYSSPFSIHNREDLIASHERSIETKAIDKILDFIKNKIDKDIQNIELTGEGDTQRFLVSHKHFKEAIDITQFGDGLQRVFHIALLFASAQNGILLIDEIENAIHHDLYIEFTRFIEEMASDFNVQLFITSHSKECINSFFINGNTNNNISAYRLIEQDGNLVCLYTEGSRFGRLIENFDADLRG